MHLEAIRAGHVVIKILAHHGTFTLTRGRTNAMLIGLIDYIVIALGIRNGADELAGWTTQHKANAAKHGNALVEEALAIAAKHWVVATDGQPGNAHTICVVLSGSQARFHIAAGPAQKLMSIAVLSHAAETRGIGRVQVARLCQLTDFIGQRKYHGSIGTIVTASHKDALCGVNLDVVSVLILADGTHYVAILVLHEHDSRSPVKNLSTGVFKRLHRERVDVLERRLILAIAEFVVPVAIGHGARERLLPADVHYRVDATVGVAVIDRVLVQVLLWNNGAHPRGAFTRARGKLLSVIRVGVVQVATLPFVHVFGGVNFFTAHGEIIIAIDNAHVAADGAPHVLGKLLHYDDLGAELGRLARSKQTGVAHADDKELRVNLLGNVRLIYNGRLAKPVRARRNGFAGRTVFFRRRRGIGKSDGRRAEGSSCSRGASGDVHKLPSRKCFHVRSPSVWKRLAHPLASSATSGPSRKT